MVRSTVFPADPRHGGTFPNYLWLEAQLPPLEDQASFHLAGADSWHRRRRDRTKGGRPGLQISGAQVSERNSSDFPGSRIIIVIIIIIMLILILITIIVIILIIIPILILILIPISS